jgi:Flp pilus assembly protein TadD
MTCANRQRRSCVQLAWSALAFTYGAGALNSDADPRELVEPMRAAVERAVREDPNLSEAQFVAGYLKWLFDWDWAGAERAFRAAVTLDRRNADAHRVLGHALSQSGRHHDAGPLMQRARELDPLDPINHALSSQVAFQQRDFTGAIAHARRAMEIRPGFWIAYMQLGQAYEQTGEIDLALEVLQDAAHLSDGNTKPTSLRGYIMAKAGRTAEAREVLRLLQARSRTRYVPPYAYALVHAGLGERGAALDWLERAEAIRDVHLVFLNVDAKWEPYHHEPRFATILARSGFEFPPTSSASGSAPGRRAARDTTSRSSSPAARLR